MIRNNLPKLLKSLQSMPKREVLVGIPGEKAARDSGEITNAQLGYIFEYGAPEAGIPARPALFPGIRDAMPKIRVHLLGAAKAQMLGNDGVALQHMHAAGQVSVNAIRARITAGIPPPLADSTLQKRASRKKGSGHRIGKGAAKELEARYATGVQSVAYAKPLIDSGQYLASFTYVVRNK